MNKAADNDAGVRFDVFISYSRRDVDFARWLERDLERYRPPDTVAQRRLSVFRDVQDLVGNELTEAISAAIERSSALLVVCSPHSRKAPWVGREIEAFVAKHGPQRVLPVLISGRPNHEVTATDDTQDQAFHEALYPHLKEPLAPDFRSFPGEPWLARRERRLEAKFQVLAFLLGTSKEALLLRQRQRWRRLVSAALVTMFCVSVAFAWIAWVAEQNKREAQRQQALAEHRLAVAQSREQASNAISMLTLDPELATVLAQHASETAPTQQAERALRLALGANRLLARYQGAGHAVSANGKTVAITRADASGSLFEVNTGATLFDDAGVGGTAVALSADGTYLAVRGDDTRAGGVWEVASRKRLFAFSDSPVELQFSPDGKRLLKITEVETDDYGAFRLQVLTVANGAILAEMLVEPRPYAVAWSADGRRLAFSPGLWFNEAKWEFLVSAGAGVRILDVDTGSIVEAGPFSGDVTVIASHPDPGLFGVGTTSGQLCLYSAVTGKKHVCEGGVDSWVSAVQVSRDGSRIAATSADGWSFVWTPAKKTLIRSAQRHERQGMAVALSSDGKYLLSGGAEGVALLFDADTGRLVLQLRPHETFINRVAFGAEGRRWITADTDGTVKVWDGRLWNDTLELRGHRQSVHNATFSHDGRYVVTYGQDIRVKVWDVATGKILAEHGPGGHGGSPEFASDPRYVYIDTTDELMVWDWQANRVMKSLLLDGGFAASAGSPRLAVRGAGSVDLYDTQTWKLLAQLNSADVGYGAWQEFSTDGKRLLAKTDAQTVGVFDASDGRVIQHVREAQKIVAMRFAPKADAVMTAAGSQVNLWQLRPLAKLHSIDTGLMLNNATLSPRGDTLLVSTMTKRDVWGNECRHVVYRGWQDSAPRDLGSTSCLIQFSPRGRFLYSWEGDVWDAQSLEPVTKVGEGLDEVYYMIFSDDERYVASAGSAVAYLYRAETFLPLADLLAAARARQKRKLSDKELDRYFPQSIYGADPATQQ